MTPEDAYRKMVELFTEYREDIGSDDQESLDRQLDYDHAIVALICEVEGHEIGPDQCGKPEHDLCYRCHRLRTDIESSVQEVSKP